MSNQFIFNQYYIDLIKRIKSSAKSMRENEKGDDYSFGKGIIKTIKEINFLSYRKSLKDQMNQRT